MVTLLANMCLCIQDILSMHLCNLNYSLLAVPRVDLDFDITLLHPFESKPDLSEEIHFQIW